MIFTLLRKALLLKSCVHTKQCWIEVISAWENLLEKKATLSLQDGLEHVFRRKDSGIFISKTDGSFQKEYIMTTTGHLLRNCELLSDQNIVFVIIREIKWATTIITSSHSLRSFCRGLTTSQLPFSTLLHEPIHRRLSDSGSAAIIKKVYFCCTQPTKKE